MATHTTATSPKQTIHQDPPASCGPGARKEKEEVVHLVLCSSVQFSSYGNGRGRPCGTTGGGAFLVRAPVVHTSTHTYGCAERILTAEFGRKVQCPVQDVTGTCNKPSRPHQLSGPWPLGSLVLCLVPCQALCSLAFQFFC